MPLQVPVAIPLDDKSRTSGTPSQMVSPKDRNPGWYYQNIRYISSFYNTESNNLLWPVAGDVLKGASTGKLNPVQRMIRMMLYYLGQQPNMDYAFIADDITNATMQAMWTNGQTVKEFVDFFRGTIRGRLANARWTSKPLSKRASNARTDMFDKAMLAYDLKPYLEKLAQESGATFSPTEQDFQVPDEVQKWIETDWKEYGSELCTDLANGIWESGRWSTKALDAFLHVVCTSNCAMHQYAQDGLMMNEIVQPYQLISDTRVDSDFGMYDEFVGVINSATPLELKRRFPEITNQQVEELERIASDSKQVEQYNTTGTNFSWFTSSSGRNMVTYVTGYWRTKNFTGKKSVLRDDNKQERLAKTKPDDPEGYVLDDIAQTTLIANKYITKTGFIDNLVESVGEVSRPMLPIQRFRPNTIMGQSVSEVERIHKMVNECDYYEYKIKEAVGRAKGKVYIIWGEKFGADNSPKEFIENITSLGINMMPKGTGEPNDPNAQGSMVDELDFTLDPNVSKYFELIQAKEEKMKRVMSISDVSMGQPQSYFGNNTMQTITNQNTIGTKPLIDGFMEWLVLCMRYNVNATKNLMTLTEDNGKEMSFYVGERGLVFIKLFPELTYEQLGVILNINDQMDDKQRERILSIALASSQNGQLPLEDYLQVEASGSVSEIQNQLQFLTKRRKQEGQQAASQEQQNQQQNIQMQQQLMFALESMKQDKETYRKEIELLTKGNVEMQKRILGALAMIQPQPQEQQPQEQPQGQEQQTTGGEQNF